MTGGHVVVVVLSACTNMLASNAARDLGLVVRECMDGCTVCSIDVEEK
jgi:hypothetical protein